MLITQENLLPYADKFLLKKEERTYISKISVKLRDYLTEFS